MEPDFLPNDWCGYRGQVTGSTPKSRSMRTYSTRKGILVTGGAGMLL